jgi:hypothetical protein
MEIGDVQIADRYRTMTGQGVGGSDFKGIGSNRTLSGPIKTANHLKCTQSNGTMVGQGIGFYQPGIIVKDYYCTMVLRLNQLTTSLGILFSPT